MKILRQVTIGNKSLNSDSDVFIIAEAGVNHNGELAIAKKLIDAAVNVKADAIKFQTFIAEDLVTANTPMAEYQEKNIQSKSTQYEMLKKLELKLEDFVTLKEYCDQRNIIFLSTPHTGGKVIDLLDKLLPAFKIGSGDLTNLPFLADIAKRKKPMILGTGMSTLAEVQDAVKIIEKTGNKDIILLHCTTNYPCPFEEVNLNALVTLASKFPYLVGYSDHTLGPQVAIMATTLGASVIEKHFTLDKTMPGPDHKASANPEEMRELIKQCRLVRTILGSSEKKPNLSEMRNIPIVRKSLFFSKDLPLGHLLEAGDFKIQRPGTGIPSSNLHKFIGKRLLNNVSSGQIVSYDCIEEK